MERLEKQMDRQTNEYIQSHEAATRVRKRDGGTEEEEGFKAPSNSAPHFIL